MGSEEAKTALIIKKDFEYAQALAENEKRIIKKRKVFNIDSYSSSVGTYYNNKITESIPKSKTSEIKQNTVDKSTISSKVSNLISNTDDDDDHKNNYHDKNDSNKKSQGVKKRGNSLATLDSHQNSVLNTSVHKCIVSKSKSINEMKEDNFNIISMKKNYVV